MWHANPPVPTWIDMLKDQNTFPYLYQLSPFHSIHQCHVGPTCQGHLQPLHISLPSSLDLSSSPSSLGRRRSPGRSSPRLAPQLPLEELAMPPPQLPLGGARREAVNTSPAAARRATAAAPPERSSLGWLSPLPLAHGQSSSMSDRHQPRGPWAELVHERSTLALQLLVGPVGKLGQSLPSPMGRARRADRPDQWPRIAKALATRGTSRDGD
jgi:hypothetical protein